MAAFQKAKKEKLFDCHLSQSKAMKKGIEFQIPRRCKTYALPYKKHKFKMYVSRLTRLTEVLVKHA